MIDMKATGSNSTASGSKKLKSRETALPKYKITKIELDIDKKNHKSSSAGAMKGYVDRTPETEAIRMRLQTVSSENSRLRVPVDPWEIAHQLGILVIKAPLKSNVAGFILKKSNGPVKIYVNRNDGLCRQRFTLAHELGHYWSHKDDSDDYGYVENRNELSSMGTDANEIAANRFAAELLMPARYVRSAWAAGMSIQEIQDKLNVSDAALGHRLVNLGLMSI